MSREGDELSAVSHDCLIRFSLTVQDGLSPLYVASQEGYSEVVDVLVKAGADVNQAGTKVCEHISYLQHPIKCDVMLSALVTPLTGCLLLSHRHLNTRRPSLTFTPLPHYSSVVVSLLSSVCEVFTVSLYSEKCRL